MPTAFEGLVALLEDNGHHAVAAQLSNGARVVRYEAPDLILSGSRPMSADTLRDVADALKKTTGTMWKIALEDAPGAPTLREKAKADEEATRQAILDTPLVKAAFAAFPEAELEAWPGKRSIA
jgi:DNA polymerase-3 subunit gamma/tau